MARILDRLIGLETEYALHIRTADPSAPQPSRFRLYERLVSAVRDRIPLVAARHFKEGVFLANGGAVWFEAERPAAGGGLIEGATPECRTPHEAVVYQRAQDRLLGDAIRSAVLPDHVTLVKNDRDARGNTYGAQENYEATLASGLSLVFWRLGLAVLFPLAVLTWLAILTCVLLTFVYFSLAGLVYGVVRLFAGHRQKLAILLFGRDLVEGRGPFIHVPIWLEAACQIMTRLATAPLAVALYLLLRWTAFRQTRRSLLPFLISRPILAGAGMVDAKGGFWLSDKAPSVNFVLGFGGMFFDRPIFTMGHFFKAIYAEAWFSPREYFRLMAPRQRLQVGLGDSNMCEVAEYLRVGTTALVLDAIEAGMFRGCPRIRRPIRALHTICRDDSLRAKVGILGDRPATALRIQRFYYDTCSLFLHRQKQVPAEAWRILELWRQTLGALHEYANHRLMAPTLIGSVDWATKKLLLDKAGADATWVERKKIDIRYHELSPEGYFQKLREAGATRVLVPESELERAMRSPPPNSPATTRGHYIREFVQGEVPISVNWKTVTIGTGWRAKVIRLSRYGRESARGSSRSDSPKRNADTE